MRRCQDILLTFFQAREVRVSRFKSYLPVVASFSCLKCLGAIVISCNIDKCRLGLECLAVARVNNGEHWFSRPSERVSLRRD